MFSFFYQSKSNKVEEEKLTRFDACKDLKHVRELIQRLREKCTDLEERGKSNGADSPDLAKYIVISKLLLQIDAVIHQFNCALPSTNRCEQIKELIKLCKDLYQAIPSFDHEQNILDTPCNQYKNLIESTVHTSIVVTAISTGGLSLASIASGYVASAIIRNSTGLMDKATDSTKAVVALRTALSSALENLKKYLKVFELQFAKQQNQEQRKWGAFALNSASSLAKHAPDEIKLHILSFVRSGYETEADEETIRKQNQKIVNVAKRKCNEFFKNKNIADDFEIVPREEISNSPKIPGPS